MKNGGKKSGIRNVPKLLTITLSKLIDTYARTMVRVILINLISFATPSIQSFHSIHPLFIWHCRSRSHKVMLETGKVVAACATGGKCLPCESLDKSHLLSPEQIEDELAGMKLWSLKDGNKISRSFTARNFQVSSCSSIFLASSVSSPPGDCLFYCCVLCSLHSAQWTALSMLENWPREKTITQICMSLDIAMSR